MGKEAVWQCCDERDVHLVIALRICQIFDTVLVLFKVFDTEFRLEERFDLV